jgi:putative tributyrin esterase
MKTARTIFLFFALTLSLGAFSQSLGTRAETIQFKSKLVGKTLPYSVVLPPGYALAGQPAISYPVLYLLHGLAGHYSNWLTKTRLAEYAAAYRMIIITPEGNDGWYTDSATVSADRYETYIVQELIPDVEKHFRAIKGREGRSVAGLSMGGYGALKFGVKYPDKFIFAASISGALDAAARSDNNPRNAWAFLRPSIMQTFGDAGSPTRAANDLHKLVLNFSAERLASLPFFYLDCGTEDGFLATNQELATIFLERKIPHEYRQLPGAHNWAYWDSQVQEVLKLAARKMNINRVATGNVGAGLVPARVFTN